MEKFNKITEKYLFENGQEKIMDKVVKRVRKEIEEKISIQRNNLIYFPLIRQTYAFLRFRCLSCPWHFKNLHF